MGDSTDFNRWLERGLSDIRYLRIAYESSLEGLENHFCYNAHQAAEKLLKSVLVKFENSVPRTHDLLLLLKNCSAYDASLISLTDASNVLNAYSIAARYPNDFEDSRSIQDATEAYGFVMEILDAVSRTINVEVERNTLKPLSL